MADYCRNLHELPSHASGADADIYTSAFLLKRLLSPIEEKWSCDTGEVQSQRSAAARNHFNEDGVKCVAAEMRPTLDTTEHFHKIGGIGPSPFSRSTGTS